MHRFPLIVAGPALLLHAGSAAAAHRAMPCEALKNSRIAHTSIESAQKLAANTAFNDFDGKPVQSSTAVCRVVASVSTQPGEKVGIEVWLPLTGWNERLLGVGSAGFGGSIPYMEMIPAVAGGFAVASTDTGHRGGSRGAIGQQLAWAQDPIQLRDWGHSSIHLMTVAAKEITQSYYGRVAKRAYYSGCSTGGAEAMEEAEFFPDDYDGIHAGSPGMAYSRLMESFLWGALLPAKHPEAALNAAALMLLNQAALQSCGGDSAVADGFLLNPLACRFEPAELLCKAGAEPAHCLSAAQVEEAQRLYPPVRNAVSGAPLYPGFARGSESQWAFIQGALVPNFAQPLLANAVFENPKWDWTSFDFAGDADKVASKLAPSSDAMSADLQQFRSRGGKLIMTQGWADPLNAQTLPMQYFEQVALRQGGVRRTQEFFRLAMAPGMGHCGGGPGANTIGGLLPPTTLTADRDVVSALQAWVEHGRAPTAFISTKYVDDKPSAGIRFERPVCIYPEVPQYDGHGDRLKAASFNCVDAARDID